MCGVGMTGEAEIPCCCYPANTYNLWAPAGQSQWVVGFCRITAVAALFEELMEGFCLTSMPTQHAPAIIMVGLLLQDTSHSQLYLGRTICLPNKHSFNIGRNTQTLCSCWRSNNWNHSDCHWIETITRNMMHYNISFVLVVKDSDDTDQPWFTFRSPRSLMKWESQPVLSV